MSELMTNLLLIKPNEQFRLLGCLLGYTIHFNDQEINRSPAKEQDSLLIESIIPGSDNKDSNKIISGRKSGRCRSTGGVELSDSDRKCCAKPLERQAHWACCAAASVQVVIPHEILPTFSASYPACEGQTVCYDMHKEMINKHGNVRQSNGNGHMRALTGLKKIINVPFESPADSVS
ncbi:hypothetical protein T12_2528 [Trichinella patagoniensis]|uniref:Uncharacterized protein n=1 Tax=Trichinella patagoniensis TaxID=990121 RepID=A0A0V1AFX4_9BILA|nr:hypothetical protein T12_2528 [Trichinella patagoniensis]